MNESFEILYNKKDYKKAIEVLLKTNKANDSGIYHYNLGTAYAQLNEFPIARFHFEKSFKAGFSKSELENNLKLVKNNLQVEEIENSNDIIDFVNNFGVDLPPFAFLTLIFLIILASVKFIFVNKILSKFRFCIALIFLLILFGVKFFYINTLKVAIVFQESIVTSGPSKIFEEKNRIKAGTKIILDKEDKDWVHVQNPRSLSGWIKKDNLGYL